MVRLLLFYQFVQRLCIVGIDQGNLVGFEGKLALPEAGRQVVEVVLDVQLPVDEEAQACTADDQRRVHYYRPAGLRVLGLVGSLGHAKE